MQIYKNSQSTEVVMTSQYNTDRYDASLEEQNCVEKVQFNEKSQDIKTSVMKMMKRDSD